MTWPGLRENAGRSANVDSDYGQTITPAGSKVPGSRELSKKMQAGINLFEL